MSEDAQYPFPQFQPRHDDIYIASYPRSGTTWMQMILYQLSTDGEMTFAHIAEVIPFFEESLRRRDDLERLPSPRIFKTHLPFRYLARRPGRFIYVVRDGRDVLLSYFRFQRTYFNYVGSLDEFFSDFMEGYVPYGSWFKHVESWNPRGERPSTLWIEYEALSREFETCLDRIAAFCNSPVLSDQRGRILEQTSFSFMKKHELKFEPRIPASKTAESIKGTFLHAGTPGGWKTVLTDEQIQAFGARCVSVGLPRGY